MAYEKTVEEIINEARIREGLEPSTSNDKMIIKALELHSRALACHCQCLAYNSANMFAVISGTTPPYGSEYYDEMLQKWGLVDKYGEPTFVK